jgi:hypothetical protein
LKKGDGQVHLRNNDINIAMNRKKKQSTEIPTSFGKRTLFQIKCPSTKQKKSGGNLEMVMEVTADFGTYSEGFNY